MTPSKIQGLFKTLPTLETLTDQATKIYLHFFLDSEAATREHASYPRSREQNLSLARLLSPAAPLTRGLPKCRRLNQSGE